MTRLHRFRARQEGFTLAELLLVVAILSVIGVISVPIYAALQNSTSLNVTSNTLVQDLYQAQIYSRSEKHNSAWGVAVNNQTITVYAGTSYAARNTAYDNSFTIPTTTTVSGLTEVDYSKLYGLPQSTGSITLTSGSATSTVTINAKGMVDY